MYAFLFLMGTIDFLIKKIDEARKIYNQMIHVDPRRIPLRYCLSSHTRESIDLLTRRSVFTAHSKGYGGVIGRVCDLQGTYWAHVRATSPEPNLHAHPSSPNT